MRAERARASAEHVRVDLRARRGRGAAGKSPAVRSWEDKAREGVCTRGEDDAILREGLVKPGAQGPVLLAQLLDRPLVLRRHEAQVGVLRLQLGRRRRELVARGGGGLGVGDDLHVQLIVLAYQPRILLPDRQCVLLCGRQLLSALLGERRELRLARLRLDEVVQQCADERRRLDAQRLVVAQP